MRSGFTLLLLLVFSTLALSQAKPVNFSGCVYNEMHIRIDEEPRWATDSITLVDFLNKHLNDPNIKSVETGKVFLGILIFPDGKTCAHSFVNNTYAALDAEKFKDAINQMPNWKPGKQGGKEVIFLKQLLLKISNGQFVSR